MLVHPASWQSSLFTQDLGNGVKMEDLKSMSVKNSIKQNIRGVGGEVLIQPPSYTTKHSPLLLVDMKHYTGQSYYWQRKLLIKNKATRVKMLLVLYVTGKRSIQPPSKQSTPAAESMEPPTQPRLPATFQGANPVGKKEVPANTPDTNSGKKPCFAMLWLTKGVGLVFNSFIE